MPREGPPSAESIASSREALLKPLAKERQRRAAISNYSTTCRSVSNVHRMAQEREPAGKDARQGPRERAAEQGATRAAKPRRQSAASPQGVRKTSINAHGDSTTANGISAGQRPNEPQIHRSGKCPNGTRRIDRLIHLSAAEIERDQMLYRLLWTFRILGLLRMDVTKCPSGYWNAFRRHQTRIGTIP